MSRAAVPAPGAAASAAAATPLVVGLRRGRVLLVLVVCAVGASIGLRLLRNELNDVEDWVLVISMLLLSFWVLALAIGTLVRHFFAGHALRIDAAGLHLPGWNVLPWSAIERAGLHRYDGPLGIKVQQLELQIDADCKSAAAGSYERWLWGPMAGLGRRKWPIRIPLFAFDISAELLLAGIEAYRRRSAVEPTTRMR